MPKTSKSKQQPKMEKIAKVETKNTSTQVMSGRVISSKTPKTVTVLVERQKIHPVYKKSFLQTKKYLVHSENDLVAGDLVEIMKVRPISKNKHWQVRRVLGRDIEAIVTQELKEEAAEVIAEVLPEEKVEEKTDGTA